MHHAVQVPTIPDVSGLVVRIATKQAVHSMQFISTPFISNCRVQPHSNDLPMYDLCKGCTRVKLEYDPLKVNRKIRNCAKYVHSASQSTKSAAAAAKLETYWLVMLTWQYMNSCLQFRTVSRMFPPDRICVGLVPQTLGLSRAPENLGCVLHKCITTGEALE